MRYVLFVLLLIVAPPAFGIETAASPWRYHCWADTGGAGVRWCRAVAEIVIRANGQKFRGAVTVRRPERGSLEIFVTGDRPLERVTLAVDEGAARVCAEPYDCDVPAAEAPGFEAEMRAGRTLAVRMATRDMGEAVVLIELDSYRRAVEGLKAMGW